MNGKFLFIRQASVFPTRQGPVPECLLEECLEYMKEDELVEVTPKSMRIRKAILDHDQRKKASRN